MEKQLRDYVKELLGDYDKLHGLLWDMMAEAYTTKQNYLGKYCLMVWDDGTIDTHYFTGNEWFRGEDEGTIYRVATVKEWNNDDHEEWEEDDDTLTDTAKRIMREYHEEVSDQIDHIIEDAKFNFDHLAD